jgi:hypothetical protein
MNLTDYLEAKQKNQSWWLKMVTGYERTYYQDISRIAKALERIANELEKQNKVV